MPQAERIGLELALDAEAELEQARALNYVSLLDGAGDTVRLRDEITGATFARQTEDRRQRVRRMDRFRQPPRSNTTRTTSAAPKARTSSSITRNSGRLSATAPSISRTRTPHVHFRAVPGQGHRRRDRYSRRRSDQVVCTDDEIAYFLEFTGARLFPGIHVRAVAHRLSFFRRPPAAGSESRVCGLISRDHRIEVVAADERTRFPIYSLVGGKWTTYRAFSEQTTDRILRDLGKTRRASTRSLPIGGGKDYPSAPARARSGLSAFKRKQGCRAHASTSSSSATARDAARRRLDRGRAGRAAARAAGLQRA